jgi:Abscisic acid G-protein coupled receptor
MLRSNLPEKYAGGIAKALGSSLRRGIFEEWFDAVYFMVAGLTAVGLFVARSWSDEDLEIEGKEV